MTTKKELPFRQKLEFLILVESEGISTRGRRVASDYYLTVKSVPSRSIEPDKEFKKAELILIAQEKDESPTDLWGRAQELLKNFGKAQVVTVMDLAVGNESLTGFSHPRMTALTYEEFFSTLKFDYLVLYHTRAQYYEIPLSDMFPMTKILFQAFLRMELNQRYLCVVHGNSLLSDDKFARIQNRTSSVFIRVKDSAAYLEYIKTYYDMSGAGLRKRFRALFFALRSYSLRLNETLLFDLKSSPLQENLDVYQGIQALATEFFEVLKTDEDLWDSIRECWDDQLSSFWRAPWIATYAALLSLKTGKGDPAAIFLAGLFKGVGLYELEESVTRTYLLSEDKKLSSEQWLSFEKHPLLSLNRLLLKQIPLSDKVKSLILRSHEENLDLQKDYPEDLQLLKFAERLDLGVLTTLKQTGTGFRFMREKLWEKERANTKEFDPKFMDQIATALL